VTFVIRDVSSLAIKRKTGRRHSSYKTYFEKVRIIDAYVRSCNSDCVVILRANGINLLCAIASCSREPGQFI
jgi:hypothetical protein